MILSQSTNDQLMAMAAHRYCLGRASYIVGACIQWIPATWGQMSEGTRKNMIRDTQEALDKGYAGMEMDRRDWTSCLGWMREHEKDPMEEWELRIGDHKSDKTKAKPSEMPSDSCEFPNLRPGGLYRLKSGENAVFRHVGGTGCAIFMPPGEPSFQDCFSIKDQEQIKGFLRMATKKELGEDDVDEDAILVAPPPKRKGKIKAKLVYKGRGKPIPTEES